MRRQSLGRTQWPQRTGEMTSLWHTTPGQGGIYGDRGQLVSQSHCEIAPASNFALLFHKETYIFTLTLTAILLQVHISYFPHEDDTVQYRSLSLSGSGLVDWVGHVVRTGHLMYIANCTLLWLPHVNATYLPQLNPRDLHCECIKI